MGLLSNGVQHLVGGVLKGATNIGGTNFGSIPMKFLTSGRMDNVSLSESYGTDGDLVGYGDDMNIPYAWHQAQTAGRMASYSTITGSGTISPNLALTLQAIANLSGTGGAEAIGGLIVQMIAAISGSGTVSSADIKAFLLMVASISGSGGAEANVSALAEMAADILASGDIDSAALTGVGELSADIRGYGDLTPEGIRDAVWNAIDSQYTATGTMGKRLNDASAAGNPWAALLAANNDPDTFGELIQALNQMIDELHKIQGLNPAAPMTVTETTRTAGDIDLEITGDGETTSTVTRV